MTRGTRKLGGRYFILAGRGTREQAGREAEGLRRRYRYVRVMVYIFEERR